MDVRYSDPICFQARNVQYVDTAEEEWSRFQKEIGDELNVAQDILVEDRNEATIDRQIEEIDEQMRAWTRYGGAFINDVTQVGARG